MIFGYARVSTDSQNLELQISMLKTFGCEKIYSDVISGKTEKRQGLQELMLHLRKGDVVVVTKIDRIFRSLRNLVQLVELFNKMGIKFKSLNDPEFDTTSPSGNLVIQLFGAIAEFERNLNSERTKIGLEHARKLNKTFGRPTGSSKKLLAKYKAVNRLIKEEQIAVQSACDLIGIPRSTYYRIKNKNEVKTPNISE